MSDRDMLVKLLAERSVRQGRFTLASGRESTLYIDARVTTMSPDGMLLIGRLGLSTIQHSGWAVDAVGGLTMGADPVACAIAYASAQSLSPLRAFTVRKEGKTHGTGRRIEGAFREGDRVAVVEDVITTGDSALTAATAVREHGGVVGGVLALVDREEGGRAKLESAGLQVVALVRASEIVARMGTGASRS